MTPTEQRIAIAEACGWEYHEFGDSMIPGWRHKNDTLGNWVEQDGLPDYLNDLNAMHEAEKHLAPGQAYTYQDKLRFVASRELQGEAQLFFLLHATAAQRAEAFLRTIGKWKD